MCVYVNNHFSTTCQVHRHERAVFRSGDDFWGVNHPNVEILRLHLRPFPSLMVLVLILVPAPWFLQEVPFYRNSWNESTSTHTLRLKSQYSGQITDTDIHRIIAIIMVHTRQSSQVLCLYTQLPFHDHKSH